jgi:hypothetical protein
MPAFARLSRGLRAFAAAALFLIPLGGATAAPARLANDADVAAFASHIKAYAGASRAQWVVAAPDAGLADAVLTAIRHHLGPRDQSLLDRIRTEIQPASGQAKAPVGWMEPRIGGPASEQPCSWQVWVSDASIPSPQAQPVPLPLASGDTLPVSPSATFRVGFTGLLQSRLYAFGETGLGRIRDLASVPDANIPVANQDPEMLVLVRSRQPVPLLEQIKASLGATAGERRELGPNLGLRDNFMGKRRGIGANIQLVEPGMVQVGQSPTPAGERATPEVVASASSADLIEACVYSLVPSNQTP